MGLPLASFVPTPSLHNPPNWIQAPFGSPTLLAHPYKDNPAVCSSPAVLSLATGGLRTAVIAAPTIPNVELKHRLPQGFGHE